MDLLRVLYKRVFSDSSHYVKKKKKNSLSSLENSRMFNKERWQWFVSSTFPPPKFALRCKNKFLMFYLWCCFSVLSADGLKVLLVMDILISSHQQALLWGSPQIAIGSKTNTTNCLFWFWWKPAAFDFSVVRSGNCICQDHWLFPPLSELLMGTSF